MADGKEYAVSNRDFISFTRNSTEVVVSTEVDKIHILPLRMVQSTQVSFLSKFKPLPFELISAPPC